MSHKIFQQRTTQTPKSHFKDFQDIFFKFKAFQTLFLIQGYSRDFKACANPENGLEFGVMESRGHYIFLDFHNFLKLEHRQKSLLFYVHER